MSREALAQVEAAWNDAGQRWDVDALTALYTDDALFFGGRPAHSVGSAQIRSYFASYEGVILSATMKLRDQHIVPLAPGSFLAQGAVDFSFILDGDQHTTSALRTTMLLVEDAGRWKIRQYHFSAMPPAPPLGRS
ncbi:MAG: SgcJ/EcaC family oxidoreductase [Pseudomonadota bacterium]